MAIITELYKGILLNRQGNEAPNGDIETAVLKTLIDRSEYITSIINAGNAGDIAMFTGNSSAALGPSAMNQVNNIVVGDFYDVLRLFTEETVDGFGIQISNSETTQNDGTKLGVTSSGHAVLSSPNQILLDTDGVLNIRGRFSERTVARITNVSNYENIAFGEETQFIEIGLDESNDEPHIRCKGYDAFYIEDYLAGIEFPKSWLHKSNYDGIRIGYDHNDTETDPIDILLDGNEVDIIGTALRFNGNTLVSLAQGTFTVNWYGFTTSVSSQVHYRIIGDVVYLRFEAFSGISNSGLLGASSGSVPSILRPISSQVYLPFGNEHGDGSLSIRLPTKIEITTDGAINFETPYGRPSTPNWQDTGDKTPVPINTQTTISYVR